MKPVRRTQAIAPFGIGALVDFPGPTSLVHAGLDAWPVDPNQPGGSEFRIDDEPRLARRLGVTFFMLPPDYRRVERGTGNGESNIGLKLPFLRFPLWHVCPYCGRMHKARFHDVGAPACEGPVNSGAERGKAHKRRKTTQVRFVAACSNGHLQDFPWLEWLRLEDPNWSPDGDYRWLRLRATGSAGSEGIEISAEERRGHDIVSIGRRNLGGAIGGGPDAGDSPLTKLGIRCIGSNPALAHAGSDVHECGEQLYVLLRGASNLYFADVVSSIYVPDVEDNSLPQEVLDLLEDHQFRQNLLLAALDSDDGLVSKRAAKKRLEVLYPQSKADPEIVAKAVNRHYLRHLLLDDGKTAATTEQLIKTANGAVTPQLVADLIKIKEPDWAIDPAVLVEQVRNWYEKVCSGPAAGTVDSGEEHDSGYRGVEYRALCRDGQDGTPKLNLLIRSNDPSAYGSPTRFAFDRISLLHKLRETRAYRGFSRIYPGDTYGPPNWKLIARSPKNWLPAIIVRGEGIFLRFNQSALDEWDRVYGDFHRERLAPVNATLAALRQRRKLSGYVVTPKEVLIHTFAHLFMNQLVFDCGYGSAALRERIYCSEDSLRMCGILVYTAAGDSEGTMGGLVRMGEPHILDQTIGRALEHASWCSTDPVCIESRGQGPDSCNLAACHACALVPETSCEEQNRLLDRGVIVGTLDNRSSGFFNFAAIEAAKSSETDGILKR